MYDVITVSALNTYIKSVIDSDNNLTDLMLRGEVSNLSNHYSSGHVYFTLKEGGCSVRAVMFKRYTQNLDFELKEGMELIVRCKPTIYEKDGAYQIYVYDATDFGAGKLYAEFKRLAMKLSDEGLFAEENKKPIPKYPEKIAIISSKNAAALQDILNIIRRRNPAVSLSIFPSRVQGDGADEELISALKKADEKGFDTIIIARGGGSLEDLWQFNSENLARTVASLKTPVISAVGHETDTTLCDLASDLRASTPSAGAELAVPTVSSIRQSLDDLSSQIELALNKKLENAENSLNNYKKRLSFAGITDELERNQKTISDFKKRLGLSVQNKLSKKQEQLIFTAKLIEEKNPISILTKGYAICKKDGKTIKSSKNLNKGDKLELIFNDGTKQATIEE